MNDSASGAKPLIFDNGRAQPRPARLAWSALTVLFWLGFLYLAVPPARAAMLTILNTLAAVPQWIASSAHSIATAHEPTLESVAGVTALLAGSACLWMAFRRGAANRLRSHALLGSPLLNGETTPAGAVLPEGQPAPRDPAQTPVHFEADQMAAIRLSQRLVAHHDANGRLQAVTLLSTGNDNSGNVGELQAACEPFLATDFAAGYAAANAADNAAVIAAAIQASQAAAARESVSKAIVQPAAKLVEPFSPFVDFEAWPLESAALTVAVVDSTEASIRDSIRDSNQDSNQDPNQDSIQTKIQTPIPTPSRSVIPPIPERPVERAGASAAPASPTPSAKVIPLPTRAAARPSPPKPEAIVATKPPARAPSRFDSTPASSRWRESITAPSLKQATAHRRAKRPDEAVFTSIAALRDAIGVGLDPGSLRPLGAPGAAGRTMKSAKSPPSARAAPDKTSTRRRWRRDGNDRAADPADATSADDAGIDEPFVHLA